TLLEMLRERLPGISLKRYTASDAKEAMAMAMIANDSVAGMHTNVAGATGGRPTILGKICL
ncbi:MAG: anhydro-N-acetylmuramic acid kinase, partial [Thermoanaerobaculia bacterium]